MNIVELFETKSNENDYTPHKAFKGVFLKHLVKGEMTDGRISCHLVKVEPFCSLETHVHPEQLEIHEVIFGDGECQIAEKKYNTLPEQWKLFRKMLRIKSLPEKAAYTFWLNSHLLYSNHNDMSKHIALVKCPCAF